MSFSAVTTVDRMPGLSHEAFIKNYLDPGIPVIIPDATRLWKAHKTWDIDLFKHRLGQKQVMVQEIHYNMHDFMETVESSEEGRPSGYLNELNIHKDMPELLNDLQPLLSYALPDRLMTKFMPASWGMRNGVLELLIGGKGTKFPTIHFDGHFMNTFVTQIRGDKEFILFPPDQTPYMYPATKGSNKSMVNDVDTPDLEKYPLFANTKPVRTILYEGETIFMPTGWWHTTRLLSLSIAVSVNNICQNQWDDFVDDFAPTLSQSPVRQKIYKTYLKIAGKVMDVTGK